MNIPNLLTVGRIVLIAPFVLAVRCGTPGCDLVAFALYAVAAVTDWLDGYLARRLGQGSEFGRMLDPIADKLLVAAALVLMVEDRRIAGFAVIAAILILMRELFVSGLREYLGPKGIVVAVTRLAKWKTATQLVALGALLLARVLPLGGAGTALLWLAAGLTVWTGYGYLKAALRTS